MSTVTLQPEKLAGIAELAEHLGVGRTTVSNWYARQATNGFPDPITDLAMGPVWDRDKVQAWWLLYRPLRNMPKVGSLPGMRP